MHRILHNRRWECLFVRKKKKKMERNIVTKRYETSYMQIFSMMKMLTNYEFEFGELFIRLTNEIMYEMKKKTK